MIICPKCEEVLSYNSYFGAYICPKCSWEVTSAKVKKNTVKTVVLKKSIPLKKATVQRKYLYN